MVDLSAFFPVTKGGAVVSKMCVAYHKASWTSAVLVLSSIHLDYGSSVGGWNAHRHVPYTVYQDTQTP